MVNSRPQRAWRNKFNQYMALGCIKKRWRLLSECKSNYRNLLLDDRLQKCFIASRGIRSKQMASAIKFCDHTDVTYSRWGQTSSLKGVVNAGMHGLCLKLAMWNTTFKPVLFSMLSDFRVNNRNKARGHLMSSMVDTWIGTVKQCLFSLGQLWIIEENMQMHIGDQ